MPVVQPADLWQEMVVKQYGPELLQFCRPWRASVPYSARPTKKLLHITDLVRNELSSYKQLPLNSSKSVTKFRDEVRVRALA